MDPLPASELLETYPESPLPGPQPSALPEPCLPPKPRHPRISPYAQEYHVGTERLYFGIPKEIELLGYLRRAHPLGIHRNLAMALLWPEYGTRIRQLDARLAQLIQRLRNIQGFKVCVSRECLSLSERDARRVLVDLSSQTPWAAKSL